MQEEKLKPCPFCGSEAIINEILPHKHSLAKFMPDCDGECFIECANCTCAISAKSKDEAIDTWNRRADND